MTHIPESSADDRNYWSTFNNIACVFPIVMIIAVISIHYTYRYKDMCGIGVNNYLVLLLQLLFCDSSGGPCIVNYFDLFLDCEYR